VGIDRSGLGAPQSRGSSLNPADPAPSGGTNQPGTVAAARVVPSVPTFAVDQGFWYAVPPSQEAIVGVGTMVRVPLGGRRVRGYVVEVGRREPGRLRPIAAISMEPRTFDGELLRSLTWAAHHYVAPVSVMLDRSAPPNLAKKANPAREVLARKKASVGPGWQFENAASYGSDRHPLALWSAAAASGKRQPPVAYIARWWDMDWLPVVAGPSLKAGASVLVVAATGDEVDLLAGAVRPWAEATLIVVSPDASDAEITTAWAAVQNGPNLIVGTPRAASWLIGDLSMVVVVEEGRRAMKDRQTPTVAVRDLMRTRAAVGGHHLCFVGPTPSLETLAGGASVVHSGRRAWAPVEVVDRQAEPPIAGVIGQVALRAIKAVAGRGGRVFVFAHRRGYAPAARCERCRTLRQCPNCGSRPETSPVCPRCGAGLGPCLNCGHDRFVPLGAGVGRIVEELRRTLDDRVGQAPADVPIQVGSEADLAAQPRLDLAVAVDPDGLILGTHYRASEEALRVLARLAGKVEGRGARCLLQTSLPDHPVFVALKKGDPVPFLEAEREVRARFGFPPAGELVILEARGSLPDGSEIWVKDAADGATILGPVARGNGGVRWLIQGTDLSKVRTRLRPLVQRWRDAGVAVRVDVDPIEL
jgi:primosomal protein N'